MARWRRDKQPEQADPHYLLAVVLAEKFGDYDRARTHYRRYLELAPESDKADEVRASLKLLDRAAALGAKPATSKPAEAPAEPAKAQMKRHTQSTSSEAWRLPLRSAFTSRQRSAADQCAARHHAN